MRLVQRDTLLALIGLFSGAGGIGAAVMADPWSIGAILGYVAIGATVLLVGYDAIRHEGLLWRLFGGRRRRYRAALAEQLRARIERRQRERSQEEYSRVVEVMQEARKIFGNDDA